MRLTPPTRQRYSCARRRFQLAFTVAVIVLTVLTATAQDLVRVKRVIDGDTIMLESGERVRLLGVNTPETKHPQKKVEAFARKRASSQHGGTKPMDRWKSFSKQSVHEREKGQTPLIGWYVDVSVHAQLVPFVYVVVRVVEGLGVCGARARDFCRWN